MNNQLDNMFALLMFIKICRTYQTLKKQKQKNITKHSRKRFNLTGVSKVKEQSKPKRNFSLFSKADKDSIHYKHKSRLVQDGSGAIKSHIPEHSSQRQLQGSTFSPAREETDEQQQCAKEEIIVSEWQESEPQLPTNAVDTIQSHGIFDVNFEDTIFEQFRENELIHRGDAVVVESQAIPDQDRSKVSFLPETAFEKVEPVLVKRKRRRRRPGDPPLSPLRKEKKKAQRRYRVRPENRNRWKESYFTKVFKNAKKDESQILHHVRMTHKSFLILLNVIFKPMQIKKQSVMTEERLAITLLHLAHGFSVRKLSEMFKLGIATVRFIVLRTCEVIWEVLSPVYMNDPNSEDYTQISEEFKKQFNLPNCAGVIGTRRVPFVARRNGTTDKFRDVKNLVLMTICDSKHIFRQTSITVEAHESKLFRDIIANLLPLPPDKPLDEESSGYDFPYYFIGSEAFPQRKNIMSPYTNLTERRIIYNNSIAFGQNVSDTAFDVLTSMWRVLLTNEGFSIENWETVIKACVVLHNFVLINDKKRWYQPNGSIKENWPDNITTEELSDWQDAKFPVTYLPNLMPVEATGSISNKSGLEARDMLSGYFCVEETIDLFQKKT